MRNENKSCQTKLARVIALTNPSASSINTTTSTSSNILDPVFPTHKACSDDSANTIFGRRFVITCKISDKNGLYKELPTMKCCVYTLYQLEMIIMSLMLNLASSATYHHSEFCGYFYLI